MKTIDIKILLPFLALVVILIPTTLVYASKSSSSNNKVAQLNDPQNNDIGVIVDLDSTKIKR
jgi:hypothetical protein